VAEEVQVALVALQVLHLQTLWSTEVTMAAVAEDQTFLGQILGQEVVHPEQLELYGEQVELSQQPTQEMYNGISY
jgi:2-keto-4-pentenoate hydratase